MTVIELILDECPRSNSKVCEFSSQSNYIALPLFRIDVAPGMRWYGASWIGMLVYKRVSPRQNKQRRINRRRDPGFFILISFLVHLLLQAGNHIDK